MFHCTGELVLPGLYIFQYSTPFFHRSVSLFTSSRARRMYKVFKESASDESGDDAEVFSSMLNGLFSAHMYVHMIHGRSS